MYNFLPTVKRFTLVLGYFSLYLMMSCQPPAEKEQEPNLYYDVEGFIRDQIELLNQKKPMVTKQMVVSGVQEARTTKEVDWSKELELFIQADINKPAYRQSYTIQQPNPLTFEYVLNSEEDLTVRHLKVILNDSTGRPSRLEARLLSQNKLYESEKNLELTCADRNGVWQIVSYRIQGFQELITSSRKPFIIQVKVQ
jgi:Zn-dependent metalloprotease